MPRLGLALLIAALSASAAGACSVPVFRYALERWPPAEYELAIFHRGPLTAADHDSIRSIRAAGPTANFKLVEVDLDDPVDPDLQTVWEREEKGATLPRVLVRYPDARPAIPSLGSEPLASVRTDTWLDSPARRAAFNRLTAGYAGVVLLLLSGDPTADEAARSMLHRELPRIARRIELPAKSADGPQVQSELPLRVEFPVIEVARTQEEEGLVRMLLRSEDGLDKVRGPIAFPVFGRGRALCSVHGKDLEEPGELRRALEFLCRACSCQVKELNPGVDLLIAGNWDQIFDAERGPVPHEVPPDDSTRAASRQPPGSGGPAAAALRSPPPVGYEAVESHSGSAARSTRASWRQYAAAGAVGLVLITGLWALRSRQRQPAQT